MDTHDQILNFIDLVRKSMTDDLAEHMYMFGHCVKFARVLEAAFPGGRIMFSGWEVVVDEEVSDSIVYHAFYNINGKYYDILGEIKHIDQEPIELKHPATIKRCEPFEFDIKTWYRERYY